MSKIQQRFYYMDAMRAVLMTLGIVLHSANVFTDSPWAIQNIQTSGAFTYIVAFLHSFRMPAFFIVSGFFCHMTLKKYGYKMFLNVRIPRVIIPLVATALLLNSVQNLVLYYYYSSDIYLLSAQYWLQGKWLSHLWFLNCLVYYFLISALMYRYLPVPLEKVSHLLSNIILKSKGIYILILPIVSLILIKLSYLIPDLPSNLYTGSIAETIKYSGFFIFGTLIGINRSLLQEIISIRILILI
ncbi:MAG: acyltransferase family protein, partial [Colwellia sp.]